MSDAELRELERRWRATGSVEDETAYLRERVRVGDLTQDQLELAAYFGQPAARRVVQVEPEESPAAWIAGLVLRGSDAWCRLAIALASELLPVWEGGTIDRRVRESVRAAEDYLGAPSPQSAARVEVTGGDAGFGILPAGGSPGQAAYRGIAHAMIAVWSAACGGPGDRPHQDLLDAMTEAELAATGTVMRAKARVAGELLS